LFKPLTFYLEIRLDGQPQEQAFLETIEEMGGRVLKRLTNAVTHVVWANGKLQSLSRARELGSKIVSPLWLEACISSQALVEEALYKPSNLEAKIKAAQRNPKKRDPGQLKIFESTKVQ